MASQQEEARWARLMTLLEPFHVQAQATARRVCRSPADGDDLYQEAVLRAFDKLETLRDDSRFRSWFFATLLSRHRTRMRRAFWRRFLPWHEAFPRGADPMSQAGHDREEQGRVERAARGLATLAPEQREAVVLFEIDGYSIEEIATFQRTSIPAVKSRLVRGREKLRRWYERQGVAPSAAPSVYSRSTGDASRKPKLRRLAAATQSGQESSDD